MKRKAKITLILSSITLILASAAQFYTNHKIDHTLQSFPYHLKDQLTLHATEKSRSFFHRELVFTLEDAQQQKSDIISTQLTALPFTIIAESQLPESLIRELNKKLNITIDKNSINSKFSVVGDYLQSDISTQFRDLANKPQDLQININFATKSKFMEIQSQLSGFNYDAKTKIEGLRGQSVLIPVSEHHYDLAELDLEIKHADIYLLNGENTHIELGKTHYHLNKTIDEAFYDLDTHVKSETVKITNKNKTTEKDAVDILGLDISSKQSNVPHQLSFYKTFENVVEENKALPDALYLLTERFFNNDATETKINIQALSVPNNASLNQFFNVNDIHLAFVADSKDKQNINTQFDVNIGKMALDGAPKEHFNLKGLTLSQKISQMNLTEKLNLLHFYTHLFKDVSTRVPFPEKDQSDFVAKLKQRAQQVNEQREFRLQVEALSYANPKFNVDVVLDDLALNHHENQQGNYDAHSTLTIKKLIHKPLGLQINEFAYQIPFHLNKRVTPSPFDICYDQTYQLLCPMYLSKKTYQTWLESFAKETNPSITDAKIGFSLDTVPNTQAYPVSAKLAFDFNPEKTKAFSFGSLETIMQWENMNIDFQLALAKGLVRNEKDTSSLPNPKVWQTLTQWVKPHGQLAPYFIENDENYLLHYVQKNGQKTINAQPFEEVMTKLDQQHEVQADESQPQGEQPEIPALNDSPPDARDEAKAP
ncbi:hypothetical protein ACNO7K_04500 [Bisgaard Taxon 45]